MEGVIRRADKFCYFGDVLCTDGGVQGLGREVQRNDGFVHERFVTESERSSEAYV